MEVLLYQVAIVFGIVAVTLLGGQQGMWLGVAVASVFTVAMVFTSWLMVLQFVTIFIGMAVSVGISESPRFKEIQVTIAGVLIALVIGGVYLESKISSESRTQAKYSQPTSSNRSATSNTSNAAEAEKASMAYVIRDIEARVPQLRRGDPRFSAVLEEEAKERMMQYQKDGYSPSQALQQAVDDMIEESRSAKSRK
jgi:hypothetical protein